MQQTLWGDQIPTRRSRKKTIPRSAALPYSITGGNDCAIIGHTLRAWDLSGCTTCLDCGVSIYCPGCITIHPQDKNAIPLLCHRHEASEESQVRQ
jgi:hypothetical protein